MTASFELGFAQHETGDARLESEAVAAINSGRLPEVSGRLDVDVETMAMVSLEAQ